MDVSVRLEDDAVLVGATPAAPAGAGLVRLDGADLLLDPTAPDDPPHLRVHDLDAALLAVELVHGAAVAAAAERVADGAPAETVAEETLAGPGGVGAAVRELALLHWLERHSPDLLPAGLLDLGVGTAAAALDDLLAESERDDGTARLLRRAGLVVELSTRLRDTPSPPPEGLAALVDAAVPATAAVLPFDSPLHDALTHEAELARAVHALGGARLDWNLLATLPGVGDRLVAGAAHAGRGDGDDVERRASVDWLQVPRGVLDTAEGTVTWSLSDGGTPRVSVTVRALPGGAPATGLAFRLYGTAVPLPIAAGGLRLAPGGTEYVGSAELHGDPVGALTLDVHDPSTRRPPRLGLDRATAEGLRWAARAVTALRLAGPSGAADPTARGAVSQAARSFRRVAVAHPRPAQQELAARRQARCYALLRAVLARGGDAREEARLAARWGVPREPVQEVDVAPPALTGAGWAALPVENALGSAPLWRTS